MASETDLLPAARWTRLSADPQGVAALPGAVVETAVAQLVIIRRFEELVLELAGAGLVHGPAHSSIGQEAAAVGSVLALVPGDHVNGSHRGHHQFLAKALCHVAPAGFDLAAKLGDASVEVLRRTLGEILGLNTGWSGGRGGSMHLRWEPAGALGTNAIVGGGVPLAAGSAWAQRASSTDAVTISYFGDGAVNIGSVLETMNLAAAWSLPLCFFIENNRYAVATTVAEATGEPRLSARGLGFGIRSWQVDGMDLAAVHAATSEAVAHMRSGGGPTIIEADVYRFYHQNGPFAGSAFGYRTRSEEAEWRDRDPLAVVPRELAAAGMISPADVEEFDRHVAEVLRALRDEYVEVVPGERGERLVVRDRFWPDPTECDRYLRAPAAEVPDPVPPSSDLGTLRKFVDVVAEVLGRRMESDPGIVLLGEDIHKLSGGTNGATRGLPERFPGRVLGTPISENAFVGLAGGIAMDGRFRPVVELMYSDFAWVAADQLFNQVGKARHMFGGTLDMPLVLRSKVAIGTGYGPQHSMDPAGLFAGQPGWRIVAPSTPADYAGLMNTALALNDPVLVLEHTDLYPTEGSVADADLDVLIPVGAANVVRAGSAVTVLTYLSMVRVAVDAAEASGVDAEVIDLRWLDQASIDWATIERSVRTTNSVLIVEQGARGLSYGGWLADEIQRRLFDWLDQPVQRVTGTFGSPTISKVLERAAYAGFDEVVAALRASQVEIGAR